MKPITVSVGPLAAANPNAVSVGQITGQNQMTPPPAAGAAASFWGPGSMTNGVLTMTLPLAGGVVTAGARLNGIGVPPGTIIIGPVPGAAPGVWQTNAGAVTLAARGFRGNPVFTFDAPRQVTIASTDAAGAITFVVNGTDAAGSPISETLVSTGATLTTQQNFASVTSVTSNGTSGPAPVGSAPTATTPWVNFDPWADPSVSKQIDVNGVANWTVQLTNDDPNSPTNPVAPGLMTWFPDPTAAFVGASTPQFGSWPFVPLYARILLNSGAGSVIGTFVQTGVVNR